MKSTLLACVGLVVTAGFAADFVWQGNDSSSWMNPGSYKDNDAEALPGADDTVTLPYGTSATVRDNEVSFVSNIGDIVLDSRNTMTFDVSGDHVVYCPIHQPTNDITSKTRQVTIVKTGSGSLELASVGKITTAGSNEQAYRASMRVEAGVLKLNQSDDASVSGHIFDIVSLEVAAGAAFWTAYGGSTFVNGSVFSGGGMVTNANTTSQMLSFNYACGTFTGTICGNIQFRPIYRPDTWINLMSDANTYADKTIVYGGGRLGLMKFGRTGEPSSLGTSGQLDLLQVGSTLHFLGTAVETTDKSIMFDTSTAVTLDAGAFGGVTFEGAWSYKSSSRFNHILDLKGSNAVECVLANSMGEPRSTASEYIYGTYIRKTGSGTWRLAHHSSRSNRGAISVEEGTLRFDSVAEAGTVCSLGLSTVLKEPASASADTATVAVPYAICVGGETTEGTFEYTGSADVSCSTRPLAVRGTGRLRNATDHDFFWQGVFGWGIGANVLTLDGDSTTAANRLDTITNVNGTLSIAKEGNGTWILDGDQTFSGTVDVKAGTLVVRRPVTHPTWFRFVVTGSAHETMAAAGVVSKSQSGSQRCMLEELAFYDAAGNRLNSSFSYVSDLANVTDLQPGQIALDGGTRLADSRRPPDHLCDGLIGGDGCDMSSPSGASGYFNVGSPSTWCRVVLRLADNAPEVTAYDFANYAGSGGGSNRGRSMETYRIETSVDGVTWTIATNVTGKIALNNVKEDGIKYSVNEWPNNGAWNSDGTLVSAAPAARPGKGYPLDTHIRDAAHVFENVSSVSVAEGAVLRTDVQDHGVVTLRGITIDPAAGVGTLEGFALAAQGVITLASLPKDNNAVFQHTFLNVSGLANLANWTLSVPSAPNKKIRMAVNAETGAIRLFRPGLGISIR